MTQTKNEQEMEALGELVLGVKDDQIDLHKRVDALADRFTILDAKVIAIDSTVAGMRPMLEKNTDMTEKAVRGAQENKKVLDRIEPSIGEILTIVTERQERDAAKRFVARWGRFCKSSMGTVAAIAASIATTAGLIWSAAKFFKG